MNLEEVENRCQLLDLINIFAMDLGEWPILVVLSFMTDGEMKRIITRMHLNRMRTGCDSGTQGGVCLPWGGGGLLTCRVGLSAYRKGCLPRHLSSWADTPWADNPSIPHAPYTTYPRYHMPLRLNPSIPYPLYTTPPLAHPLYHTSSIPHPSIQHPRLYYTHPLYHTPSEKTDACENITPTPLYFVCGR